MTADPPSPVQILDRSDALAEVLRVRIQSSGMLARLMNGRLFFTKSFLVFNLLLTPFFLLVRLFIGEGSGNWEALAILLLLIAWGCQWRGLWLIRLPPGAAVFACAQLQAVSAEKDRTGLWKMLTKLSTRMGLNNRRFDLQISTGNNGFGPSIVELDPSGHGTILLVIPLGWLKFNRAVPLAAEAMIAHELGHVLNRDSQRWLQALAYRRAVRVLLAASVWSGVSLLVFSIAETGQDVRWFDPVTLCIGLIYQIGFYPLIVYSHLRFIRKARRYSEETADCCAAVYVSADAIRSALQFCKTNSNCTNTHDHPPPTWRLKRLDDFYQGQSGIVVDLLLSYVIGKIIDVLPVIMIFVAIVGIPYFMFAFASDLSSRTVAIVVSLLMCLLFGGIAWSQLITKRDQ